MIQSCFLAQLLEDGLFGFPELCSLLDASRTSGHHPLMPDSSPPRNPFFALTAFSAVLFVITILALVASVFGDPRAPLAGILNEYGGVLMAGEVVVILFAGFLALFVDRRQTLRSQNDSSKTPHEQERQS